ncbi:unnamed protein product [Blepharisma stoltei]|uniref:FHA domain-containing protein n=1 Tax=Blepharisma stoltei TaxID=1481888 RepID=A0AAU9JP76_9CILI|nr:unnamed protein product [Blepharisma stoltei]
MWDDSRKGGHFNVRQEIPGIEDLDNNWEKNIKVIPSCLNTWGETSIKDLVRFIDLSSLKTSIKPKEVKEEEEKTDHWMLILDNKDQYIIEGKKFAIGKTNSLGKPDLWFPYFNDNQIELTVEKGHLLIQEAPSIQLISCKIIEKSLLLFPGLALKAGNCILEVQEVNGSNSLTVTFGLMDSDRARYVIENKRVTLGRAKDDFIYNPDLTLTRKHAEILCVNGIWIIKALDSKKLYRYFHTTYTIEKQTKSVKTEVFENDIILLGQSELRVERMD